MAIEFYSITLQRVPPKVISPFYFLFRFILKKLIHSGVVLKEVLRPFKKSSMQKQE